MTTPPATGADARPDAPALPVQTDRLSKAAAASPLRRWLVRALCHLLVELCRASALVLAAIPRRRPAAGSGARIALTGAFLADNWLAAHVLPLALSRECAHVWVVADAPRLPLPKVTYVVAPAWLARLAGRVLARSLTLVVTSWRHRVHVVGGFHLLYNAMLAIVTASSLGARSFYFCVGGWSEFLGGGAYSGHRLFGRLGMHDQRLENKMMWVIRRFDLVLTMGTRACRHLLDRGVARVEVMPGGIQPQRFAEPGPGQGEEPPYDLVLVARLDPIKRIDVFLRVVKEVLQGIPAARAAVVGDGPLRTELESDAEALGISESVTFAGFQADVGAWLRRSRVFVLTSDSEGLALSLMEAMTAGLPAVVSRVGDLADLVVDGETGFLAEPRDVSAFAERILALLTDPALRERCGSNARRHAAGFSLDAMRQRWDRVLTAP